VRQLQRPREAHTAAIHGIDGDSAVAMLAQPAGRDWGLPIVYNRIGITEQPREVQQPCESISAGHQTCGTEVARLVLRDGLTWIR